jgi:carbon storage regulator CsrA
MLVLSRKWHEDIQVGDGITIRVLAISGKKVRLGIVCPKEIPIQRGEIEAKAGLQPAAEDTLRSRPVPAALRVATRGNGSDCY